MAADSVLEINRELVVSTCHIPESLALALDRVGLDEAVTYTGPALGPIPRQASDAERALLKDVFFACIPYGYRIYAGSDHQNKEAPPELQPLLDLAYRNDCKWVVLDCDGLVVEGLQQWEW